VSISAPVWKGRSGELGPGDTDSGGVYELEAADPEGHPLAIANYHSRSVGLSPISLQDPLEP